ncbi:MAG: HNH endonuclease [Alphaproteobacteria bacterium]|nr:HNH endonuclease [Alphaproteobacteria bacterium]MCW5741282.1 HNH endonuclease [Alphaproteobacteria bacterium]
MAYWWLNQNEDEIDFWDEELIVVPRRDKLGKTAPGFMTAAAMKPGDLGFAFVGGDLEAVFAVVGPGEEEVVELGSDHQRRPARIVPGRFFDLPTPLAFESLSTLLRGALPIVESPLQPGNERAETRVFPIGEGVAQRLIHAMLAGDPVAGGAVGEAMATALGAGERDDEAVEALVAARLGAGKFGEEVRALWRDTCAATGTTNPGLVIVAPIKPWVLASDEERLDPQNGLLLTPTWHVAFSHGLIAFEDDGMVMLARHLDAEDARRAGIDPEFRLAIKGERQAAYLAAHRAALFDG